MDREILFRGKRLDNGEWVYGYLIRHPSAAQIGDDCSPWYISVPPKDPDDLGGVYNVDPSTVGQYTGLTDRNGKRIFEGDIVEAGDYTAEDGYGEIIWDGDDAKYAILGCNGNTLMTDFEAYYGHELEVIGNIYDNPELLGGAENA